MMAPSRVLALNGSFGAVQIFPQLGVKRPRLSRIHVAQFDPTRTHGRLQLEAPSNVLY